MILRFCVIDSLLCWNNTKKKGKHKLIVVFDGQGAGNSSEIRPAGIDVVFSRQDLDADEEIKEDGESQ